jgi:MFS family permease
MLTTSPPRLLAQKPFVRFWLARLAGVTANQMLMVAVAWHMYDLTSSAWDLGLVELFQFVPALLMWAAHGGFATRELIFAISVVLGLARAFQMPAQQALTPSLVPPELLQRAIALNATAIQIAVIGGPALGGALYIQGVSAVYGSAAALLLASCLLTLLVRYRHQPGKETASWRSVLAGVGVGVVWQRKVLLGAISLDLFAVLLGGATALLPIYALDILHTGPEGLGLLRAAPAVGALLMSLVLMRWPLRRHVGRRLLAAVAVFGLATVVFGLSTNFMLSWLALALTGAADNISVVTRLTLVQLETPDAMRGRVAAVNSLFIGASNQLGEFESGATAEWFGPVGSVVLGGLGTVLIAAVWLRQFPALARRDHMV